MTKQIQEKLTEMLAELHRVCEENQIPYYILSGTVLGAVRHQGFIPWDDDIDIGLFRKDYERLRALPETVWMEPFLLADYTKMEEYPYCYAKLYNQATTRYEKDYANRPAGLYLDIFPIDEAGNTKLTAWCRSKIVLVKQWFLIYAISDTKHKNPLKALLAALAKRHSVRWWQESLECTLQRRQGKPQYYVANFLSIYRWKEVMPRRYFGTPQQYRFGTLQVYGPAQPKEYLTHLYGDYLALPPVEEQKSHHAVEYINLELPYEQYKQKYAEK